MPLRLLAHANRLGSMHDDDEKRRKAVVHQPQTEIAQRSQQGEEEEPTTATGKIKLMWRRCDAPRCTAPWVARWRAAGEQVS